MPHIGKKNPHFAPDFGSNLCMYIDRSRYELEKKLQSLAARREARAHKQRMQAKQAAEFFNADGPSFDPITANCNINAIFLSLCQTEFDLVLDYLDRERLWWGPGAAKSGDPSAGCGVLCVVWGADGAARRGQGRTVVASPCGESWAGWALV